MQEEAVFRWQYLGDLHPQKAQDLISVAARDIFSEEGVWGGTVVRCGVLPRRERRV